MATQNYTSANNIKDMILNQMTSGYFDIENTNMLNVGMLGLALDYMATGTEDVLNILSMYIKEIMPNTAQLPETIYNHAARLQIEDMTATPAQMEIIIFIEESDIVSKGTPAGQHINFHIDSDMVVDVEGKRFMMDYGVLITAKPHRGDYIFTATYVMDSDNSISDVTNPYIRTRRLNHSGSKYLGLILTVRNIDKFTRIENLIDNDKINLPTLSFTFNDQLAGFDVLYREPGAADYIQLTKRLFNASPIKDPFCFYRLRDESTVEISFTMREGYFQPMFNSEIVIRYYTTIGADGNFPIYKGEQFLVIPSSEVYDYNNNVVILGAAQSESFGGKPRMDLESLRLKIVELTSTSGAYNTSEDLQLFFNNSSNGDNKILFIKRRDDALERLFSAFSLYRDSKGDIFSTNTVNLNVYTDQFDTAFVVSGRNLIKPGKILKYVGANFDLVEMASGATIDDDLSALNEQFLFTNPYLISVNRDRGVIGYYLNSLNDSIVVDYDYINPDSKVQFICNNLTVQRNAIGGEDEFTLRISLLPTLDDDLKIVDQNGVSTGNLRVIASIEDFTPNELAVIEFELVSTSQNTYTFEAKLKTDDYMTLVDKFRVIDIKNPETFETENAMVPMYDCKVNIHALFKYDVATDKVPHKYDYIPDLLPYTMTNIYTTENNRINFIKPLNMIRSQLEYIPLENPPIDPTEPNYYMRIKSVPVVRAESMQDVEKYQELIKALYRQYNDIEKNILGLVTNNYGVDMKFYRTYGRSRNFYLEGNNTRLDRVNVAIYFRVAKKIGVEDYEVVRDLQIFIKNYIENLNEKGSNAIYVSNMITEIETRFSDYVQYMKFVRINEYDSSVQAILNNSVNVETMTKDEVRQYVPEYITIDLNDIAIEIISN